MTNLLSNCAKSKRTRSQDQFIEKLKRISPNIRVVGEFKGTRSSVAVECTSCGNKWSTAANNLLRGSNCVVCMRQRQTKTHETFVKEVSERLPTITLIGKYTASNKKIAAKCNVCGHQWEPFAGNLRKGEGCPKCALIEQGNRNRKPHDTFVDEIATLHPDIQVIGEYKNSRTKLSLQCLKCGNRWEATPTALYNNRGCPRCAKGGTSFAEQFILWSFREVLGEERVLSRDKSALGVELDIYIPHLHIAIEPGSWFWHKDKFESDKIKEQLCSEANIRYLAIYDSCPPSIVGDDNHYVFHEYLVSPPDFTQLKSLVTELLQVAGVQHNLNDDSWQTIAHRAYKYSKAMSVEEFSERLSVVNQNLKILAKTFNISKKVLTLCKVCRHQWEVNPYSLLRGSGCPKCAGVATKTHDEFVDDLKKISPTLMVVGKYQNSHSKIMVKCVKCNYSWNVAVSSLLAGHGCPVCSGRLKKNTEVFTVQLSAILPKVEVIGQYKNNRTPIHVRCSDCGNIWSPTPKDLLNGHGCIVCTGKQKKTTESFRAELTFIVPQIDVLGEYVRNDSPIQVRCKDCGYVWESKPVVLLKGKGCPKCHDRHSGTRKQNEIIAWRTNNPTGTQKQCHDETGISLNTIGKWWHTEK